jgi:putative transposase
LPRGARVDAPGTIHHVWSRGVERGVIFGDDGDRFDLRDRMASIAPECGASVPAWAFLGNHFHLVVRTGPVRISTLMRRVLTGYALRFNQRHARSGYVFQGRFGSRIVGDSTGLMTIIRYVHRNPVEAGIVRDLDGLEDYRWCGHAALVGRRAPHSFEAVSLALSVFDDDAHNARRMLREWMREPDEGSPSPDRFSEIVDEVCRDLGVSRGAVMGRARSALASRARALICRRLVDELGSAQAEVARQLGISRTAVMYALRRQGHVS